MFINTLESFFRLSMKRVASFVVLIFTLTVIMPPQGYGQMVGLPEVGQMVTMSTAYQPTLMQGLRVYPDDALRFDFMMHTGDSGLSGEALKAESQRLIAYFLTSLTVPETDMWVNLSPYEGNRIVPAAFGQTEMGRDLLAQDYLLKQLTASLVYPEEELGQDFWDRVYAKAHEALGHTDIPLSTFNKVWVMPQRAVVYENSQANTAFVVDSYLKVMLEEDYLALKENRHNEDFGGDQVEASTFTGASNISSEAIRNIIIPEIEKEINQGQQFARLRQVYNALILATWYKDNLKESILTQAYADQNKVKGVDLNDPAVNQEIYQQYLAAFKRGVYEYIREDYNPVIDQIIQRKYFSGGVQALNMTEIYDVTDNPYGASVKDSYNKMVKALPAGEATGNVSEKGLAYIVEGGGMFTGDIGGAVQKQLVGVQDSIGQGGTVTFTPASDFSGDVNDLSIDLNMTHEAALEEKIVDWTMLALEKFAANITITTSQGTRVVIPMIKVVDPAVSQFTKSGVYYFGERFEGKNVIVEVVANNELVVSEEVALRDSHVFQQHAAMITEEQIKLLVEEGEILNQEEIPEIARELAQFMVGAEYAGQDGLTPDQRQFLDGLNLNETRDQQKALNVLNSPQTLMVKNVFKFSILDNAFSKNFNIPQGLANMGAFHQAVRQRLQEAGVVVRGRVETQQMMSMISERMGEDFNSIVINILQVAQGDVDVMMTFLDIMRRQQMILNINYDQLLAEIVVDNVENTTAAQREVAQQYLNGLNKGGDLSKVLADTRRQIIMFNNILTEHQDEENSSITNMRGVVKNLNNRAVEIEVQINDVKKEVQKKQARWRQALQEVTDAQMEEARTAKKTETSYRNPLLRKIILAMLGMGVLFSMFLSGDFMPPSAVDVDLTNLVQVVQQIDAQGDNNDGFLGGVIQAAVVTAAQDSDGGIIGDGLGIDTTTPASTGEKAFLEGTVTYTVKSGDTLMDLAKRLLGEETSWDSMTKTQIQNIAEEANAIAKVNNLPAIDMENLKASYPYLKTGVTLLMPMATQLADATLDLPAGHFMQVQQDTVTGNISAEPTHVSNYDFKDRLYRAEQEGVTYYPLETINLVPAAVIVSTEGVTTYDITDAGWLNQLQAVKEAQGGLEQIVNGIKANGFMMNVEKVIPIVNQLTDLKEGIVDEPIRKTYQEGHEKVLREHIMQISVDVALLEQATDAYHFNPTTIQAEAINNAVEQANNSIANLGDQLGIPLTLGLWTLPFRNKRQKSSRDKNEEDVGGIDLEKVGIQVQRDGSGVRTAFEDPQQLERLINSDGLGPVIYGIQPTTLPILNMFLGRVVDDETGIPVLPDEPWMMQGALLSTCQDYQEILI